MLSCIYHGYVRHRRLTPAKHAFRYGLYMLYLDLDELPSLLQGGAGLSRARFSPASFRRTDHLGPPPQPLAGAVGDLVEERTGRRPDGPIRLLTLPRNFGYRFCPLSLYYCYDRGGRTVETVVAEVSNTPWLEQHWYVLGAGNCTAAPPRLRFRHPKDFHVSPFMAMDVEYEWRLTAPGPRLAAAIVSSQNGARLFDVGLSLRRRELGRWNMFRTLLRYPWMTVRVTQAIYWQALRLRGKRCPFYPHPELRRTPETKQP
jgi:uncharacterized protein